MNVKIWPRSKKETGGYACMPLKGNIPPGQERLEINHLPGMRRSVLGDSSLAEYQTI